MSTKTHPSTTHFDAKLLQDYLEGTLNANERQRVEQLLSDSELSREAVLGYTAMPGAFADISSIRAEIASRSGLSSASTTLSNVWTKWILFAGGFAVAAITTVWIWPSAKEQKSSPQLFVSELPIVTSDSMKPLLPETEHFINPATKPIKVEVKSAQKASTKQVSPLQSSPSLVSKDAPFSPIESKPIITPIPVLKPIEEARQAHFRYNFPIEYILDLKITDFSRYYEQSIATKAISLTGLPAEYEDTSSLRKRKKDDDGRKVSAEKFLRQALTAYREERYGRCIAQFEILLANSPDDINAKFYMAVCYSKLELYNKALPLLDDVLISPNNAFYQEAEWYKALTLLNTGNSFEAKELFQKILDEGGFYQLQAKEKLLNMQ